MYHTGPCMPKTDAENVIPPSKRNIVEQIKVNLVHHFIDRKYTFRKSTNPWPNKSYAIISDSIIFTGGSGGSCIKRITLRYVYSAEAWYDSSSEIEAKVNTCDCSRVACCVDVSVRLEGAMGTMSETVLLPHGRVISPR